MCNKIFCVYSREVLLCPCASSSASYMSSRLSCRASLLSTLRGRIEVEGVSSMTASPCCATSPTPNIAASLCAASPCHVVGHECIALQHTRHASDTCIAQDTYHVQPRTSCISQAPGTSACIAPAGRLPSTVSCTRVGRSCCCFSAPAAGASCGSGGSSAGRSSALP